MATPSSSAKTTKYILLLIEDNPLLTGMYKAAFEKKGIEVLVAHDGESGLTIVKERKPSLVLLDMLMPGIDGLTVLERIKKDPQIADTTVVMLTVVQDEEKQKRARELGATDYLVKPDLELREIVERVMRHLAV